MGNDDKLQIKKDMWWEIRETQTHIACVRQSIENDIKLMRNVAQAWERKCLTAEQGNLIRTDSDMPQSVKPYHPVSDLTQKLEDLATAESKLKELEANFSQLLS